MTNFLKILRNLRVNGLRFGLAMAFMLSPLSKMSQAAEGALSHYLPGAGGDLFLATTPQPGFLAANTFWYQNGKAGRAVLSGELDVDLEVTTLLNLTAMTYTFEEVIFGGTYTIGGMVPIGGANLDFTVTGLPGGPRQVSEDSFNLSDIAFIPFQMNWSSGMWSYKLQEIIIAPTGAYNTTNRVNLGRNYWSFDTVAAVTWFDPAKGFEFSIAPGIMVNTENSATQYKTGTEFHVDFTINQFLAQNFAVGLKGYYYKQISGDSGAGAILGDFKGESFGVGPGFTWIPKSGGGKVTVLGKWLHDFSSENRFDSDTVTLTAAFKF